MTFILFLLGIVAIFIIARYNESNALFWKLMFSFLLGMAATSVYMALNKQNKESLTQVCPMQASTTDSGLTTCLFPSGLVEFAEDFSQAPAGKVYTPASSEVNLIPSKVFGRTRDQPTSISRRKIIRNMNFFDTS